MRTHAIASLRLALSYVAIEGLNRPAAASFSMQSSWRIELAFKSEKAQQSLLRVRFQLGGHFTGIGDLAARPSKVAPCSIASEQLLMSPST